jgi:type IV secretory pathway VirB10-like protein
MVGSSEKRAEKETNNKIAESGLMILLSFSLSFCLSRSAARKGAARRMFQVVGGEKKKKKKKKKTPVPKKKKKKNLARVSFGFF